MSYFYVYLGNIQLIPLIVTLDDVSLQVDARQNFVLDFQASMTAFFLLSIDTTFRIQEIGEDQWKIDISAEADVLSLESSLSLSASMNTKTAALSNFEIDMSLADGFLSMNGQYEEKGSTKVISGAISIPLLGCEADLDLIVTDEGADFSSKVELFGGSLSRIEVTAKWDWTLNKFEGSVENFKMGPFQVDNVSYIADATNDCVRATPVAEACVCCWNK